MPTGFTSSVAGEPEERPDRRTVFREQTRWAPPENEIPGAVAVNAVLGRSESLAVALVNAQVYSVGIAFSMFVSWRGSDDSISEELFGHHHSRSGRPPSGDALLFGVQFADGQSATNLARGRPPRDAGPSLTQRGGSGGAHRCLISYWLTPLPDDGLTLICAWPGRGIDETHTVIRGADIQAARAAAVELWPWEPDPEPEQLPEPPPIELPPGSWFAEHAEPPQDPQAGRGWTAYG